MHGGAHGITLWRTSVLSVTGVMDVPWEAARQTDEFWSSAAPERLVIPGDFPPVSYAAFAAQAAWKAMPTSTARLFSVYRNGYHNDDIIGSHTSSVLNTAHVVGGSNAWVEVHPGDWFTMEVHSHTVPVNLLWTEQNTFLSMHWLGEP